MRAEGEAKAAEMIGKAIMNNPGFLALRKIENARDIAANMAHSNNRNFLDAETLLLNVQEEYVPHTHSVESKGSFFFDVLAHPPPPSDTHAFTSP